LVVCFTGLRYTNLDRSMNMGYGTEPLVFSLQVDLTSSTTIRGRTVEPYGAFGPGNVVRSTFTATRTGPASATFCDCDPSLPGQPAPASVTAVASNGRATVSWVPAPDNGASFTGWEIVQVVGLIPLKHEVVAALPPPSPTSLVVTGLTNGWKYRFKVRALNQCTYGGAFRTSNAVTPSA
jgi:hypothetical protein